MANLTRQQLLSVSPRTPSGPQGPCWRRIDCALAGVVPVWGTLVEFAGRYLLEDLASPLPTAPPKMFSSEDEAIGWLVEQINANEMFVRRAVDAMNSVVTAVPVAPAIVDKPSALFEGT